MSKGLEALEKINHTVCLAFNENNNALFNKDNYEHIDCKDIYEFIDCYNIIEKALEMTQIVKRLFKDANLRDYDHLQPCDKKLVSREEWNNFLKWLKEKDNE